MKNRSQFTTEEIMKFLGSVDLQNKSLPRIANGQKAIRTVVRYIADSAANIVTNGGIVNMPDLAPAVGKTNFYKGNSLPKGVYWVIIGLRALNETTAAATTSSAQWNEDAPANMLNGDFKINQNGEGDLVELSGSTLCNIHNTVSRGNDDDFVSISPIVIRPETEFQLIQRFAGGAAANHLVKYEFLILEIVDSARV